jgi:hypothetical protein
VFSSFSWLLGAEKVGARSFGGGPFVTGCTAAYDRVTLGLRVSPNVTSTDSAGHDATFGPPRSLGVHPAPEPRRAPGPGASSRTRPRSLVAHPARSLVAHPAITAMTKLVRINT